MALSLSRQLKYKLDKALKEFDITSAQISVIKVIQSSQKLITAAEIAQYLGSDRPTISGIINRLEKKRILVKVDNSQDKRSSYLQINEESNELIRKIISMSDELTLDIFSIYTEKEANQLTEMLERLLEAKLLNKINKKE